MTTMLSLLQKSDASVVMLATSDRDQSVLRLTAVRGADGVLCEPYVDGVVTSLTDPSVASAPPLPLELDVHEYHTKAGVLAAITGTLGPFPTPFMLRCPSGQHRPIVTMKCQLDSVTNVQVVHIHAMVGRGLIPSLSELWATVLCPGASAAVLPPGALDLGESFLLRLALPC